jgi:hypothetical protein
MDRAVEVVILLVAGCGGGSGGSARFGEEVVSFEPGDGSGYGRDRFPGVVIGPPAAGGAPSLDVLSLGAGGVIVIGFGDADIVDGPGPDFVVFENPFWIRGDPKDPYRELGEVSVSSDGVAWQPFACDVAGIGDGRFPGCAGWTPTAEVDPETALDPAASGGDAFDLAALGVASARYVRVRDLEGSGEAPAVGFDLDAVGVSSFAVR